MNDPPYELVVTAPAARAIRDRLPEAVAAAVIEFLTGALIENPHRVGRELRQELAGRYSARRGAYRVQYRVDEVKHEVVSYSGSNIGPPPTEATDRARRIGSS